MKIFVSHSHRDTALVREIRSYLPKHISTWLDEDDLLIACDVGGSIKHAIKEIADFVIIFLGQEAIRSPWVKKELEWALERESEIGRPFILPILLDDVWQQVEPKEFQERLYFTCFDQSEPDVVALAERLNQHLFAWLSQHMDGEAAAKLDERRRQEQGKAAMDALVELATKNDEYVKNYSEGFEKECRQLVVGLEPLPEVIRIQKVKNRLRQITEDRRRTNPGEDKPLVTDKEVEPESGIDSVKVINRRLTHVLAQLAMSKSKSFDRKFISLLEELQKDVDLLEKNGSPLKEILDYIRNFGSSNREAWTR